MVDSLSANRLRFVSAMALLFVLSSILMFSVSALSNREITISSISEAEQSMAEAYEAVLDAERVGANVSSLLVRLNDGAGLLSEAHMAFEVGDFEEAVRFAELSSEVAWEVGGEAEWLEVEANTVGVSRSRWFILASFLGVSFVIVANLLGYEYFKRRYYRQLSKMRPRVRQV